MDYGNAKIAENVRAVKLDTIDYREENHKKLSERRYITIMPYICHSLPTVIYFILFFLYFKAKAQC